MSLVPKAVIGNVTIEILELKQMAGANNLKDLWPWKHRIRPLTHFMILKMSLSTLVPKEEFWCPVGLNT